MPTGYITRDGLWEGYNNITTVISSSSSNGYSGAGATWPNNTSQVLTMASDEYPTAISFSGVCGGENNGGTLKIRLCDRYSNNYHDLGSINLAARYEDAQVSSSDQYGNTIWLPHYHYDEEPMNHFDASGPWPDLIGATLALRKYDSSSSPSLHKTTINVVTEFVKKTVTFTHNVGGKILINGVETNSTTMVRGSTIQFTIVPDRGFAIKESRKTGGSWSVASMSGGNAVYDFTMSSPAQDVTITVEFKQLIFNITKNVSLTEVGAISGPDTAIAGDSVTVTRPTTSTEYRFDGWTIKNGDADISFTTSGSNAVFTMPASNVIVTAKYTKHTITWSGAYLSAQHEDGWDHVTLTYRGVATDNFASQGHTISYWIYKNGVKHTQLQDAPNAGNQTIDIPVVSGEENNEVRYSLVAECSPLTVGAATVSLHVGSVNRTVKYCKKNGKKLEWVECVPYFCVGPKIESSMQGTRYSQYIRVSYPGTYETSFNARPDKIYTFRNTSDEQSTVVFEDEHDETTVQYESNTVTIDPGAEVTTTIPTTRKNAIFNVVGEGSVSLECEEYVLLESNQKWNKGVWVEVEPFYFHGSDGWQLCSFV